MNTLLETYWPAIVAALVLGLIVAWYLFHASRRTRINGAARDVLDEGAAPAARNAALIDAPPAAVASDPVPAAMAEPAANEIGRIKGVGPKLVARLGELGVTSLDQIAAWDDAEIDRIDAQLDRFAGRIRRDDWTGQARLLLAGDEAGYAAKYGAPG